MTAIDHPRGVEIEFNSEGLARCSPRSLQGIASMDYDYIIWDDPDDPRGNVVHINAAGITPDEVEEVLKGPGTETSSRRPPQRPAKFGWTRSGKHLFVVYECFEEAGFVVLYVITAYEVEPLY